MKPRMLVSALFKFRNLLVLLIGFAGAYLANGLLMRFFSGVQDITIAGVYGVAVLAYLGFTFQSLLSKEFQEEYRRNEKIRHLRYLNRLCQQNGLDARKYANSTYQQKLKKVMQDKADMLELFFKGEYSYLKEKIVEQTLNLVLAYVKLLKNFCIRSRELSTVDLSDVVARMNANRRKLNFMRDPVAAEDVKRLIEMDERAVNRVRDEKMELERASAKLEYMESTISAFKHQIFSNIESEEMLETLDTAINEATALESVLEERKRNRIVM